MVTTSLPLVQNTGSTVSNIRRVSSTSISPGRRRKLVLDNRLRATESTARRKDFVINISCCPLLATRQSASLQDFCDPRFGALIQLVVSNGGLGGHSAHHR